MAEKEEKPEKAEKPEKPPQEQPAAPKSEKGGAVIEEKKRRKISRMNLSEVEAKLKTVKEKMGDFQSNFARHLLARKSELIESSTSQVKK